MKIRKGTTTISGSAFSRSKLASVTIPNSVTEIGSYAFSYCTSLKSVTIPGSVSGDNHGFDGVNEGWFYECSNLSKVTLSEGIKSLGDYMFYNCKSLKTITIPASVETIIFSEDGAAEPAAYIESWHQFSNPFKGCTSLTNINVSKKNKNFTSVDGVVYSKDKKTLVCWPVGKTKGNIPKTVTKIGEKAFEGSSIKTITIPGNVKSIDKYAFSGCTSLQKVIMKNGVTDIGNNAFNGCTNLKSVLIPKSVKGSYSDEKNYSSKKICENYFYHIDETAFENLYGLTIYGTSGSGAQTYAKQLGITFKDKSKFPK